MDRAAEPSCASAKRVNMMKKLYVPLLLVLLTVFLYGCAEEVEKKNAISVATNATITIYFRGPVDPTQYKYYMLFSAASGIKIPNVSLANPYFFRPGEYYDPARIQAFVATDNISYYYENYFYSWGDAVMFKNGQYTIAQGPFPSTANSTIHNAYGSGTLFPVQDSSPENTVQITFSLSNLNRGVDPDRIYFNFITTELGGSTTANEGLLYDHLESEPSIVNISGAEVSEYDSSEDSAKPAGADIIKWTFRIK